MIIAPQLNAERVNCLSAILICRTEFRSAELG